MKALLSLAVVFLLLSACTTALTGQGNAVRVVSESEAAGCTFIGTVSGFDTLGANTGRESENAMNEARNKAAQLGANALKILHMQTTFQGTTVTAQALQCQFNDSGE